MHLYTDGSYHSEEQAGFAVTLIAKHTDGSYTFQGAVAGHLDTDAELCMANGPISNDTAETVAITWALVMAAAMQGHYDVVIHPDSTTAIGAAKVGPASEANRLIGIIANGMHHYVSEQRNLSYEHIHGHTGHPWNELSDCLADAGATHAIPAMRHSLAQLLCLHNASGKVTEGPVPWLFLCALAPERAMAYPSLHGDILKVTFADTQPLEEQLAIPSLRHCDKRRKVKTKVALNLCTANVLTLQSRAAAPGLIWLHGPT